MKNKRKYSDISGGAASLLQTIDAGLDDVRELVTCKICVHFMYEPFTTECGHTFCYGCLMKWFERDANKKSCPDCRAKVKSQPAPSFALRDIVHLLSTRAELLGAEESTREHNEWREQEKQKLELDRVGKSGLFSGIFSRGPSIGRIIDRQDGVIRCPRCTWELEHGICISCGYNGSDEEDEYEDSDVVSGDGWSTDGRNLIQPGEDGDPLDLDEAEAFLGPEVQGLLSSDVPYSLHSLTDQETCFDETDEDDESVGSMDNFIVNDDVSIGNANESGQTSGDQESESESDVGNIIQLMSSENESDSSGITQAATPDMDLIRMVAATGEESDSEPLPTRQGRVSRVDNIRRPHGHDRVSTAPRNTSNATLGQTRARRAVVLSSDSDSHSPVRPQRLRTRPPLIRHLPQDDKHGPRFIDASTDEENSNERSSRITTLRYQSTSPRSRQNLLATRPGLAVSSNSLEHSSTGNQTCKERHGRNIPGVYPPTFPHSEPSQSNQLPRDPMRNPYLSAASNRPSLLTLQEAMANDSPPETTSSRRPRKAERKRQRREPRGEVPTQRITIEV